MRARDGQRTGQVETTREKCLHEKVNKKVLHDTAREHPETNVIRFLQRRLGKGGRKEPPGEPKTKEAERTRVDVARRARQRKIDVEAEAEPPQEE